MGYFGTTAYGLVLKVIKSTPIFCLRLRLLVFRAISSYCKVKAVIGVNN